MLYINVENSRMYEVFEILMLHGFWYRCHGRQAEAPEGAAQFNFFKKSKYVFVIL